MKKLILFFLIISNSIYSNNINSNTESDSKIYLNLIQVLEISLEKSINEVSSKNGFYTNPLIKIPFPNQNENVKKKLFSFGMKKQIEEFEFNMNVAAEKASKDALNIFLQEIKNLEINKLKKIMDGDKDEATQYLKKNCSIYLYDRFLPIISEKLNNENVVNMWDVLLNRYNNLPFIKKIEFDLPDYVTNKTIEGIFILMSKYEKNIRQNAKSSKSNLIKNFFN
tara:strand:- start:1034 stop:1705 length:672 start_codon:yes stop_codon:yes gene_type:complete